MKGIAKPNPDLLHRFVESVCAEFSPRRIPRDLSAVREFKDIRNFVVYNLLAPGPMDPELTSRFRYYLQDKVGEENAVDLLENIRKLEDPSLNHEDRKSIEAEVFPLIKGVVRDIISVNPVKYPLSRFLT